MLKGVLIFAGGAVIGGAGASVFWLLREKKEAQRHESEIVELKEYYSAQADARANTRANELVKDLMAKGYLVKGESSLDNPDLVTPEVIAELEKEEDDGTEENTEDPSPESSGSDPPKMEVEHRNLFDTHGVPGGDFERVGPKETSLIRDRRPAGLTNEELKKAHRAGMDGRKQDGHYTHYGEYSRSQAKRETQQAIKTWAEEMEADMIAAATESQYDEGGVLMSEEGPDEATLQHTTIDIPPSERPDHPVVITRGEFETTYPLYEKEIFVVYLLDGVMCREDGELIDDPFLYVGVTEPASLWPPNWEEVGAGTLFIRNHRLSIDIQVMPLYRSYAEDVLGHGEFDD